MQNKPNVVFWMKTMLSVLVVLSTWPALFAQTIQINGTIVDNKSLESVPGIHIFTDAHVGTISDGEGNFAFEVNYLDTLHFTGVGYDSMAVIITDREAHQQLFISIKSSTRMLREVEITGFYQAPTIIRLPEREVYKVPGIYYPENPRGKNYKLGLGAVASPATAIYRMFSKKYKEEKKAHEWLKKKSVEDTLFARASENLDAAFKQINEYLDDYYYRDFIHYSGLGMRYVAESSQYELITALPEALKTYRAYLRKQEDE